MASLLRARAEVLVVPGSTGRETQSCARWEATSRLLVVLLERRLDRHLGVRVGGGQHDRPLRLPHERLKRGPEAAVLLEDEVDVLLPQVRSRVLPIMSSVCIPVEQHADEVEESTMEETTVNGEQAEGGEKKLDEDQRKEAIRKANEAREKAKQQQQQEMAQVKEGVTPVISSDANDGEAVA